MRAALVASCLRGALPPVDLRAVCLVRAMVVCLGLGKAGLSVAARGESAARGRLAQQNRTAKRWPAERARRRQKADAATRARWRGEGAARWRRRGGRGGGCGACRRDASLAASAI